MTYDATITVSVTLSFDAIRTLGKNVAEIHPNSADPFTSEALAIKPLLICLAVSTMCQAELKYYFVVIICEGMND